MSRVGKAIQQQRMKKGITPKQLGKKCGVSEAFILDIEGGKKIINEKLLAQISKVLGGNLEENMVLEAPPQEKKEQETLEKKPQKFMETTSSKRREVEPLAQWGEALSNIIKQIPIYDMAMVDRKGYKSFPIIDKKVEGFHPDKLIYIQLEDDTLSEYRMKKGDRCLIYLNHEPMNGTFQLVEYDKKTYLRKVKRVEGNKIKLIKGTADSQAVIKEMKDIKILGKLIRVEIDF
ncbi:helix-turn-helix domain-containing protein [Natronincola ferrireducens]|uniref:Helix-turn-helix n=1 Tax=Natronincola ferrireducens TaxID=393762 RepID=A0A1G9DSW4_9FIRM|nr:helix-turn-helix transcriptional regulator [Natronincola ferrireducens]SDK66973.1 Helix-turn-helix [Natronincola ferrireducens]